MTDALAFAGPPAVAVLADAGYRVIAQDAAFDDAARAEAFLRQRPGVQVLGAGEPEALIEAAWALAGEVDVLFSNDAYPAVHGSVEAADPEALQRTLDNLVMRPFRRARAAIPRLRQQGRGNLIFVTSCRTDLPMRGGAIPDMARAAANALVLSLAIELAPLGIPVNAIAPNFLASELYFPAAQFEDSPAGRDFVASVVPAGRLGRADEIGELIRYLADMRGSVHTGSIIRFAGGWPVATPRPG